MDGQAERMFKRRLFLVVYVLAVLGFFEFCVRVALRNESFVLKLYSDDNESFWRLWFVQRKRPSDADVFYCHVYSPTRGWAVLPNLRDIHCMPTNPKAVLNTNAHGLRGLREFDYARNGQRRIAVLGDSFTFGEEVSDNDTYCAQLARLAPQVEVMNFGVRGYGFDQMLLYLREEVVRYHPDVVLLAFPYLDVARDRLAFRDSPKPRFVLENGKLVLSNTPVPRGAQVMAEEPYRIKLLDLLSLLSTKAFGEQSRAEEARAVTTAILDEIAQTVRAAGSEPVFFYMPVLEELADKSPELSERERYLADFCRQRKIRCLQLRPAFAKSPLKLVTEGHWTPQEHSIAAEALRGLLLPGAANGFPKGVE